MTNIKQRTSWTLTALATEFSTTRETLKKRLAIAKVKPAKTVRGHARYYLRDVLNVWLGSAESGFDPNSLPAFQRRAFFQSERERLRLLAEARELIPRLEVEQEMAGMIKLLVQTLESLPDIMERDCGLSGQAVAKMEALIDQAREELYSRLVEDGDEVAAK